MKYDILQFIDSDTLREMLRGKQLEPAIECILIAQSRKQSMEDKLDALSERETAFSEIELQAGIYNLRDSDSFSNSLKEYIKEMRKIMKFTDIVSDKYYFQIDDDENTPYSHTFHSFADAISYLCNIYSECSMIERRKLCDENEWLIRYELNDDYEIVAITIFGDCDWNINYAFAELPHEYQVGDMIRHRDEYFVIANISRATKETRWLDFADSGDMSLYCFAYSPNKLHSCGGTYGHAHIPILQAERIAPDNLPDDMKPLLALSLMLKGEMKITDFLESYSNGMLPDLMQYYERKEP